MVEQSEVMFVLLKLKYMAVIPLNCQIVTLTRRDQKPELSTELERGWLDRAVEKETRILRSDLGYCYYQWDIISANAPLFTVFGIHFDNIYLFIGEEQIYWIFFQDPPMFRRIEGFSPIMVSYCACCFHNQYLKVLTSIRKLIRGHYGFE